MKLDDPIIGHRVAWKWLGIKCLGEDMQSIFIQTSLNI